MVCVVGHLFGAHNPPIERVPPRVDFYHSFPPHPPNQYLPASWATSSKNNFAALASISKTSPRTYCLTSAASDFTSTSSKLKPCSSCTSSMLPPFEFLL